MLAIGASVALPVIGAGTADAASGGSVWNSVAACESGNNWSINTGNGFYGGLQFTSSTWAAYGGTAYAPQANQASQAQQIAVAQRVLAGQGPGAWPVCSVKAGLTSANGGASSSSSAPATQVQSSTTRSSSASTTSGSRSTYAPRHAAAAPATTKSEPVSSTPVTTHHAASSSVASTGSYVVVSGDTLSGIAGKHHVSGGWEALYAANRGVVGGNPNMIFPGEKISL